MTTGTLKPSNNSASQFSWPTPPYASYPGAVPWKEPQPCEVEGLNGMRRECLLVNLNLAERHAVIQVPPSRFSMPLQFAQFRSLSLGNLLSPNEATASDDFAEILGYRPTIDYHIEFGDGSTSTGRTVGHVESEAGLFLFPPVGELGTVRCLFMPREIYQSVRFGGQLGQVLVEQKAVTEQQVEQAAEAQKDLRNLKLGDYLVQHEIVSPDQLMQALEHAGATGRRAGKAEAGAHRTAWRTAGAHRQDHA